MENKEGALLFPERPFKAGTYQRWRETLEIMDESGLPDDEPELTDAFRLAVSLAEGKVAEYKAWEERMRAVMRQAVGKTWRLMRDGRTVSLIFPYGVRMGSVSVIYVATDTPSAMVCDHVFDTPSLYKYGDRLEPVTRDEFEKTVMAHLSAKINKHWKD